MQHRNLLEYINLSVIQAMSGNIPWEMHIETKKFVP